MTKNKLIDELAHQMKTNSEHAAAMLSQVLESLNVIAKTDDVLLFTFLEQFPVFQKYARHASSAKINASFPFRSEPLRRNQHHFDAAGHAASANQDARETEMCA